MINFSEVYLSRIDGVRKFLGRRDAYLICDPKNMFYITGFDTAGVFAVIAAKKLYFFLPEMLREQFEQMFPASEITGIRDFGKKFNVLKREGVRNIYLDSHNVSYSLAEKILKIKGFRFRALSKNTPLEKMRMVKDVGEINFIEKACLITAKTFNWIKKRLKPGMTETDVSRLIKRKMIQLGADGVGFEPIAAFGGNSAYPHHVSGNRKLGKEGIVLLDFGCVYMGYNSDLTRTIYLSKIPKLYKKISKIVLAAYKKAVRLVRPGRKISDIDKAARKFIGFCGYKKNFMHSLGHGVGLEIHEPPSVNSKNTGCLKAGMVITIEPGIYLSGFGGVRYEDTVLVTRKGCRVLTRA